MCCTGEKSLRDDGTEPGLLCECESRNREDDPKLGSRRGTVKCLAGSPDRGKRASQEPGRGALGRISGNLVKLRQKSENVA